MFMAISLIPIMIIGGTVGFQTSWMLNGLILVVTFITSLIISYFITRPIEKLTRNIDEISKGNLDAQLENSEIYEINKLTGSLNRVMTSLKLAIHKVGVKKGEIFEKPVKLVDTFEGKYDELLNNIMGWTWEINGEGVYTFCSKNISTILGYNPEEVVGKSIYSFMPSDEAERIKDAFNGASKKKEPMRDLECWYVRKNGKKVCMVTNTIPILDDSGNLRGYRGLDIDITMSKNSDEKIKKLNTELVDLKKEMTQLLNDRDKPKKGKKVAKPSIETGDLEEKWTEHEFDSVFIFDENAKILDCNENMYKRLGYSKSEMLSLYISDFDALESQTDLLDKINKAKKTGSINFKTIHKRKDGSAILVHENLQYLKDKNTFKCIVREDYSLNKSS